jgi:hypothetical protein
MLSCMANRELLDIIQKGPRAWNQWRTENFRLVPDLREANLIRANLKDVDLSGVNLREADLNAADLERAILKGADLSGANVRWAHCEEADLTGANLTEVNFNFAELRRVKFRRADLTRAYFNGTNLDEAAFSEATMDGTVFCDTNLTRVVGLDTCYHLSPSIVDYSTLAQSGPIPLSFLRGCGLPDKLIDYLPSLLNDALQFYSCFISYSHNDKAFTRRLFDTLQGRGIRCWLDEKQLRPGDDIYEEVDRGVRLWDKVLLCCSKDSLTSWWVDNEIGKHSRRNRPS